MLQENIAIKHPTVPYAFSEADLAASQTATAIPVVGADIATYLIPTDGFIVGYSINKSASHNAGSLDFDLTVNGTSVLTIAADTTSVYKTLPGDSYAVDAGQTIGVTYTSDGSLSPTTIDVSIVVYVVHRDFNF